MTTMQRWRAADERAVDLEVAVLEASLRSLQGRGKPPTPEDWARAGAARAEAKALFPAAMAEVDRVNARANAVLDAAGSGVRRAPSVRPCALRGDRRGP
ncbi:hypothetical protein HK414_17955 [Ramlibacter terrae]|uniref:Uncharacterized protein n=1 Tax=Ramlibacter terrae TaxID=2732511 RepID=A0ABX6P436_9BURK|nr:hypothetical protein HK414_17955 [Ramlibacter terrae]